MASPNVESPTTSCLCSTGSSEVRMPGVAVFEDFE